MTDLRTPQYQGLIGEKLVIEWVEDQRLVWMYGKDLMALDRRLMELPHNDVLYRVSERYRRRIKELCGAEHNRLLDLVREYKVSTTPETNQRGFPDLMVRANGLTFIEVKTNTANLLQSQRRFLSLARNFAFDCLLARVKIGVRRTSLSIESLLV